MMKVVIYFMLCGSIFAGWTESIWTKTNTAVTYQHLKEYYEAVNERCGATLYQRLTGAGTTNWYFYTEPFNTLTAISGTNRGYSSPLVWAITYQFGYTTNITHPGTTNCFTNTSLRYINISLTGFPDTVYLYSVGTDVIAATNSAGIPTNSVEVDVGAMSTSGSLLYEIDNKFLSVIPYYADARYVNNGDAVKSWYTNRSFAYYTSTDVAWTTAGKDTYYGCYEDDYGGTYQVWSYKQSFINAHGDQAPRLGYNHATTLGYFIDKRESPYTYTTNYGDTCIGTNYTEAGTDAFLAEDLIMWERSIVQTVPITTTSVARMWGVRNMEWPEISSQILYIASVCITNTRIETNIVAGVTNRNNFYQLGIEKKCGAEVTSYSTSAIPYYWMNKGANYADGHLAFNSFVHTMPSTDDFSSVANFVIPRRTMVYTAAPDVDRTNDFYTPEYAGRYFYSDGDYSIYTCILNITDMYSAPDSPMGGTFLEREETNGQNSFVGATITVYAHPIATYKTIPVSSSGREGYISISTMLARKSLLSKLKYSIPDSGAIRWTGYTDESGGTLKKTKGGTSNTYANALSIYTAASVSNSYTAGGAPSCIIQSYSIGIYDCFYGVSATKEFSGLYCYPNNPLWNGRPSVIHPYMSVGRRGIGVHTYVDVTGSGLDTGIQEIVPGGITTTGSDLDEQSVIPDLTSVSIPEDNDTFPSPNNPDTDTYCYPNTVGSGEFVGKINVSGYECALVLSVIEWDFDYE